MNVRKKVRQLPLRLSAGGYIINSGLSKWNADEVTAKELRGCGVCALRAFRSGRNSPDRILRRPAGTLSAHSGHARGGKSATDAAGYPAFEGCLAGWHRR